MNKVPRCGPCGKLLTPQEAASYRYCCEDCWCLRREGLGYWCGAGDYSGQPLGVPYEVSKQGAKGKGPRPKRR